MSANDVLRFADRRCCANSLKLASRAKKLLFVFRNGFAAVENKTVKL